PVSPLKLEEERMSKRYILANGTIINPSGGKSAVGSVLIEGKKILGIELGSIEPSEAEVIDCTGKWIVPGLIDLHVHLREPGFEWKETVETGSRAAVAGGYTTVCCMPNTEPAIDHAEVAQIIASRARDAGLAKVVPIGAVSKGRIGKELAPLYELRDAGCLAFSDDGDPVWDAGMMRRALEIARDLGAPICCHEEDKSLSCCGSMDECGHSFKLGIPGWPAVAEEVMIARDIELARTTGGSVHLCHVSTARGALLVERAKQDGISVTAEVTPHHLMLTHLEVDGVNTAFKMSPPLRSPEDVEGLRAALASGVIDCIASDHAPHESDSKDVEFEAASMGILGLQTNLPIALKLVRDGVISKERAVEALSVRPAEIFSLEAGVLKKGAAADLVVVDPEQKWIFSKSNNKSKSMNSPFLGREFAGGPVETFVDGKRFINELEDR
ncbi:MAG: dihydroorotase, partial [Bdellovibrionales bacterium]|nr:dihydroorotase [Bdellovibrionales bacterium]